MALHAANPNLARRPGIYTTAWLRMLSEASVSNGENGRLAYAERGSARLGTGTGNFVDAAVFEGILRSTEPERLDLARGD